jgi:excisionase family DNA binding protein
MQVALNEGKGKAEIDWDHPLVKKGMIPGSLLAEVFGLDHSYLKRWARREKIPCKRTGTEYWFSETSLKKWLENND